MNTLSYILSEAKKKKKKEKLAKIKYIGEPNKYGVTEFTTSGGDLRHGLRNKNTKTTILKAEYRISNNHKNYYWLIGKNYNEWALFAPDGKKITNFIFNGAFEISNKYLALSNKSGWKIYNSDGTVALPDEYDDVDFVDNPKSLVLTNGSEIEHRDIKTLEIIKTAYDEIVEKLSTDLLLVSKDGEIGIFDKKANNYVLQPKYDEDDYYAFRLGGKEYIQLMFNNRSGVVDYYGNTVIPFNYSDIEYREPIKIGDDILVPVTTVSENENLFSLKQRREILDANYDKFEIQKKNNVLYISGFTYDRERTSGVIRYDGEKIKTILPEFFSNVDFASSSISATFDDGEHTYAFDYDGRPKGDVNKKMIRDIFRYIR
jgi:hypothetical protein